MSLLQVKGLGKVYNTKLGMRQCVALKNVSFEVIEGEFVASLGASGSGKSTLLNLLASLDKPTTGDVLLDNKSFLSIPDRELSEFRRKHLGFVFQDFNLLDTFSLKDNILLPLVLMQTPVREMEERYRLLAKEKVRNIDQFNAKVVSPQYDGENKNNPLPGPAHGLIPINKIIFRYIDII